nr:hypothetical protein [Actinoplanes missouriensis]
MEEQAGEGRTWTEVLEQWDLIVADLHSEYGIDVDDRALMRRRSWRWLQIRIEGLVLTKSRLSRALNPPE